MSFRRGSNPQPFDSKSNALSIAPRKLLSSTEIIYLFYTLHPHVSHNLLYIAYTYSTSVLQTLIAREPQHAASHCIPHVDRLQIYSVDQLDLYWSRFGAREVYEKGPSELCEFNGETVCARLSAYSCDSSTTRMATSHVIYIRH